MRRQSSVGKVSLCHLQTSQRWSSKDHHRCVRWEEWARNRQWSQESRPQNKQGRRLSLWITLAYLRVLIALLRLLTNLWSKQAKLIVLLSYRKLLINSCSKFKSIPRLSIWRFTWETRFANPQLKILFSDQSVLLSPTLDHLVLFTNLNSSVALSKSDQQRLSSSNLR